MKKISLLIFVLVTALSSCTKSNYNCTCVTTSIGFPTVTTVKTIKDTKPKANTSCTTGNYTSKAGDVTTTCTLK